MICFHRIGVDTVLVMPVDFESTGMVAESMRENEFVHQKVVSVVQSSDVVQHYVIASNSLAVPPSMDRMRCVIASNSLAVEPNDCLMLALIFFFPSGTFFSRPVRNTLSLVKTGNELPIDFAFYLGKTFGKVVCELYFFAFFYYYTEGIFKLSEWRSHRRCQ
jgi:hypothetical protein